jgi:hypothetical protein
MAWFYVNGDFANYNYLPFADHPFQFPPIWCVSGLSPHVTTCPLMLILHFRKHLGYYVHGVIWCGVCEIKHSASKANCSRCDRKRPVRRSIINYTGREATGDIERSNLLQWWQDITFYYRHRLYNPVLGKVMASVDVCNDDYLMVMPSQTARTCMSYQHATSNVRTQSPIDIYSDENMRQE